MTQSFSTLGIRHELVDLLQKDGVIQPTPIQQQAIPHLLQGYDLIGQAQTGTGKTLGFVLPILERIDTTEPHVQALVITPTRELALQITDEVKKLAPAVGVKTLAAYGGQDVTAQVHKLRGSIHLVIGTPGRLLDHLGRGTIDLSELKMLVLDEADQMLHMGFQREVEKIIGQSSEERQTMLFSATMAPEIRAIAKRYMRNPVEVQVQSKRITLDEIEQVVIETTDRGRVEDLVKTIKRYNPYLGIIFCRTKRRASALNEQLIAYGFESDELHGDLTQAKREKVMKRFREAKIQLLVATDVAARGLDVEGVTHVFNYDMPGDTESYIHRIGRTGRAGERGVAVTFITPKDKNFWAQIEQGIQRKVPRRTAGGEKAPERRDNPRQDRGDRGGRGERGASGPRKDFSGAKNPYQKKKAAGAPGRSEQQGNERRGDKTAGKGYGQRDNNVSGKGYGQRDNNVSGKGYGQRDNNASNKGYGQRDNNASAKGYGQRDNNASAQGYGRRDNNASAQGYGRRDNATAQGAGQRGNAGTRTTGGGGGRPGGKSYSAGGGNRPAKGGRPASRRGR